MRNTFLVISSFFIAPVVSSQRVKGRRAATGVERAAQVETVLKAIYPEAAFQWDPDLAIRVGSGPLTPVDLTGFTAARQSDGSVNGVTGIEVGTAKLDYIDKLKKLQSISTRNFQTTIVAFRIDSSGHISDLKKISLDPSDPITKIEWLAIQKWPVGGWPSLRLDYSSFIRETNSLGMIGWDSVLDMATGSFLARIPTAVAVIHKGGQQANDIVSVRRSSPTQIQITGNSTKKVIDYPCTDRCVVDGPTLLRDWSE